MATEGGHCIYPSPITLSPPILLHGLLVSSSGIMDLLRSFKLYSRSPSGHRRMGLEDDEEEKETLITPYDALTSPGRSRRRIFELFLMTFGGVSLFLLIALFAAHTSGIARLPSSFEAGWETEIGQYSTLLLSTRSTQSFTHPLKHRTTVPKIVGRAHPLHRRSRSR